MTERCSLSLLFTGSQSALNSQMCCVGQVQREGERLKQAMALQDNYSEDAQPSAPPSETIKIPPSSSISCLRLSNAVLVGDSALP